MDHTQHYDAYQHADNQTDQYGNPQALPAQEVPPQETTLEQIDFSSPEVWAMLGFSAVPEFPPVTVADFPMMPPIPSALVDVPLDQLEGVRIVGRVGAEIAFVPGMVVEFADAGTVPIPIQVQDIEATDSPFVFIVKTEHRNVRAFKCRYCDQMFLKKQQLVHHQQDHENRVFQCPYPSCERRFETEQLLKNHFRVHKTQDELLRPHACPEPGCPERYALREDMVAHLKTHPMNRVPKPVPTGERPVECPDCKKLILGQQHLAIHMRSHQGDRPHACPYDGCFKSFKYKGDLSTHIRTHTGERPFKCTFEGCGKAFADHSTLRGHIRIHTGERPHVCHLCNSGFVQITKLKRHLKAIHNVTELPPDYKPRKPEDSIAKTPSMPQVSNKDKAPQTETKEENESKKSEDPSHIEKEVKDLIDVETTKPETPAKKRKPRRKKSKSINLLDDDSDEDVPENSPGAEESKKEEKEAEKETEPEADVDYTTPSARKGRGKRKSAPYE